MQGPAWRSSKAMKQKDGADGLIINSLLSDGTTISKSPGRSLKCVKF